MHVVCRIMYNSTPFETVISNAFVKIKDFRFSNDFLQSVNQISIEFQIELDYFKRLGHAINLHGRVSTTFK